MTLLFGCALSTWRNFRFEYPGILSCERSSIFRNVRKRSHPREIKQKFGKSLTGNSRCIDFLPCRYRQIFWLNGSNFRKLSKDVFVPLGFLSIVPEFLGEWNFQVFADSLLRRFSSWNFQNFWLNCLPFENSEQFLEFAKLFLGNFHTSCLLSETSELFWLNRKYLLPALTEIQKVSTNLF